MHWILFVYCLLPIGLFSLILVSLPMGKYFNSKLILLGSLRIPCMKINIIQFLTGISIITFTLTTYTVYKYSKIQESNWNGIGFNPTCIRWRAERNFWICTTNIIIYQAIYVIYNIKKILYEERITRKEKETLNETDSILPSLCAVWAGRRKRKKIDDLALKEVNFVSNEEAKKK